MRVIRPIFLRFGVPIALIVAGSYADNPVMEWALLGLGGAAILALLALYLIHGDTPKIPKANECRFCGYVLHGLPDRRCPECGNEF